MHKLNSLMSFLFKLFGSSQFMPWPQEPLLWGKGNLETKAVAGGLSRWHRPRMGAGGWGSSRLRGWLRQVGLPGHCPLWVSGPFPNFFL